MHAFRRLQVWRKAHELTLRVYAVADALRGRYPDLASQLTRAAQSVPANIAEGSGRASGQQFAHFLQLAVGSARELDYFLRLAADLGALANRDHASLEARTDEVIRMLIGLRVRVRSRSVGPGGASAAVRPSTTGRNDAAMTPGRHRGGVPKRTDP
jgi:four helix bundle protein